MNADFVLSSFDLIARRIVPLCVVALALAVLRNFRRAEQSRRVAREQKSLVATGTMTGFTVCFGLLIHLGTRTGIGVLPVAGIAHTVLVGIGLFLMIAGTATNILGRFQLGENWANQATVYDDQTLVTRGVYALVRHPLYASLIWMFYGASLIYLNWTAFLANSLIFVPMMCYRAGIEEGMLGECFPEYKSYRQAVGMLLPHW